MHFVSEGHYQQIISSTWILSNASLQDHLLYFSLAYTWFWEDRGWRKLFWKVGFFNSDSFARAKYFWNIYWQHNIDDITELIPELLSCLIPQLNMLWCQQPHGQEDCQSHVALKKTSHDPRDATFNIDF